MRPILLSVLVLASLAGCRSTATRPAEPPVAPVVPAVRTLPGGLLGNGVAHRDGALLLGADAGPLLGYLACERFADGEDEAHLASAAHLTAVELFDQASRAEDLRRAVELLGRALSLDPDHAEILNNLGLARLWLGDAVAAAKDLEHALAVTPAFPPARANLDRVRARRR